MFSGLPCKFIVLTRCTVVMRHKCTSIENIFQNVEGYRVGMPKPQELVVGMKGYQTLVIPFLHLLLYMTSFCGLCYKTTGNSMVKRTKNVEMVLLV